ncbi:hypothetical protein RD792_004986 [Penstemon davidsonii]|uniref:Uncharacterized protein n=1 Tax=Penstemon davidsonii TaxID=160366 RepID=A0ABR0DIY2_9LAMI|nr:hypothetical protein RD792_004986 [Penstemon davidsonii]
MESSMIMGSYVYGIWIACSFPQGTLGSHCDTLIVWYFHPIALTLILFLQVWEKSGYNTVEWVRYITKGGSYEVRC